MAPELCKRHDILKVVNRRFADIHIQIAPSRVQGPGAEKEVAAALELLNSGLAGKPSDLIIVARGGGSLEDLTAFNSEEVARAVFASNIPVISAVGHETDYTICDFAADLRAPTPSAAAELAVPSRDELEKQCYELSRSLQTDFYKYLERKHAELQSLSARLVSPGRKLVDLRLKTDEITSRLVGNFFNQLKQKQTDLAWRIEMLQVCSPLKLRPRIKERLKQGNSDLFYFLKLYLNDKRAGLNELSVRLQAVNPEVILDRGYSITRTIPERMIVKDAAAVAIDDILEIMLCKGSILCRVEGKTDNDETNI